MKKTVARRVGLGAAALVAGLVSGSAFYAQAEESAPPPIEARGSGEELPPYERLSNGGTAGVWKYGTPDSERPDYMPAEGEKGRAGYLKVEEAFPGEIAPPKSDREALQRNADRLQPDSEGKVWAPVYGDDGETIIDRVLLSDQADDEF